MLVFFKIDSTGFPNYNLPASASTQPRILQISVLKTTDEGVVTECASTIVNPGCPIPAAATAANGITNDMASCSVTSELQALIELDSDIMNAGRAVVFSKKFQLAMIQVSGYMPHLHFCCRHEGKETVPIDDVLEMATPIVNLPPTSRMLEVGTATPKYPSLEEAYRYFFNEEMADTKDSMCKLKAIARIYFAIREKVA